MSITAVPLEEPSGRPLPNRVPQVTPDFWLIKLMAVTMGETAADYLAVNLGLGLTTTSVLMTAVLVVALAAQFAAGRYVPWRYWLAVVPISVVGTLVTDNLVDTLSVGLATCVIGFTVALALTFLAWYRSEGTLSIHWNVTTKRGSIYWLAILIPDDGDAPWRRTRPDCLRRGSHAGIGGPRSGLRTRADCRASGLPGHTFNATSTAPAAIRTTPSQFVADRRSPRKSVAITATMTTLSLSIGATRDASPSFSARK